LKSHTEKHGEILIAPSKLPRRFSTCLSTKVGFETLKLSGPDGKPTHTPTKVPAPK
jgi:hypothetical protein